MPLSLLVLMVQLKFLRHLTILGMVFVSFSALAVTYSDAICEHINGSSSNASLPGSPIVLKSSICLLVELTICFL